MLHVDIITIFPDYFREAFDYGIVRRARGAGLVNILAHDLRAWTTDKHHVVDDRPFGGGDGMVLKPEPIFAAVASLAGANRRENVATRKRVVLLSPQGQTFTQAAAAEFASCEQLVLICGRYEGVDERVAEALVTDEFSIGDYVLSGGEPAALVLVDAVARLIPGALGSETSALNESFTTEGLLDCPHYTRPTEFRGMRVPDVLTGGNHREIARWRHEAALRKTERNRPELVNMHRLDSIEKAQLRTNIPDFQPGDTVRVHVRIKESETKERLQVFEGVVIARKHGGPRETITVRKTSFGVGVERIFPLHATIIDHIDLVKRGRVRRAKLYYLRELRGKAARIRERDTRTKTGEARGASAAGKTK